MGMYERVLRGNRRVAVALVFVALAFAIQGVVALRDEAWLVAVGTGALTALTATAAVRTWRPRPVD
jgi:hypothetical protein